MRSKILSCLFVCSVMALGCGDESAGSGNKGTNGGTSNTTSNTTSTTNTGNTQGGTTGGGGVVTDPTCANGLCTCPAGLVLCGTECVDLSVNTNHCGSCRRDCGSGASTCVSGQCECDASAIQCDNQCVDVSSDPNNCGGCGNDCNNNEQCISGNCEPLMCTGGEVACRGGCVDVSADTQNCGGCGNTCFGGEVCQSGQCVCNGGACADIGNDGRVVGGPCSDMNMCAAGSECLTDPDLFPTGMCSTTCQASADCPMGTECVSVGNNTGMCLLACDGNDMCRNNYECRNRNLFDQNQGNNEARVCIAGG